ncbi:hypothetical protein [Streptomyces sp. UNOC14_S4]|uniref:hypothetical protein n=1 Tax=Streptomyces sp. UNOC14_S4 TaxID=2872340 RepID=UPI001E5FD392|nr:hypothetical protein [Streptomyces sp. UNOC14_S4]MCC3767315.1 hypothetical protein [Streptomyces sp. UNOC14_S4]
MTRDCFIIVGYNNTRIYDVAKLRELCRREYRADLVLVTEQVRPQDHAAADVVLRAPLGNADSGMAAESVVRDIRRLGLRPVGILPFSDRGVPLGAWLARHFALPGAEPAQAAAGLDKLRFREIESAARAHPDGYLPLLSLPVHTLPEFEAAVRRLGGTAFVKPVNEGNSRGCQAVSSVDMCPGVWETLRPYHASGVMVETLVRDASEYSWDFVGGFRWLTEKRTTDEGRFRAEIQQIVPAPLEEEQAAALDRAGTHVRELVSAGSGAFHNELFLMADGVAAVETNMRPGGMRIWDLARLSFADFDPWRVWLHWSVSGDMRHVRLEPRSYSGIRMLRAPRDGILMGLPDVVRLADALDIRMHEAAFSSSPSDRVRVDVEDNGDFIGHIVVTADDHKTLLDQLDILARAIEERTLVQEP